MLRPKPKGSAARATGTPKQAASSSSQRVPKTASWTPVLAVWETEDLDLEPPKTRGGHSTAWEPPKKKPRSGVARIFESNDASEDDVWEPPPKFDPSAKMMKGDWLCPQCGNHNFASRTECNNCQGAWYCPSCNNCNAGNRLKCNRCNDSSHPMIEETVKKLSLNQETRDRLEGLTLRVLQETVASFSPPVHSSLGAANCNLLLLGHIWQVEERLKQEAAKGRGKGKDGQRGSGGNKKEKKKERDRQRKKPSKWDQGPTPLPSETIDNNAAFNNAAVNDAAFNNAAVNIAGVHIAAFNNTAVNIAGVHNAAFNNAAVNSVGVHNAAFNNAAVNSAGVHNAAFNNAAVNSAAISTAQLPLEPAVFAFGDTAQLPIEPAVFPFGDTAQLPIEQPNLQSASTQNLHSHASMATQRRSKEILPNGMDKETWRQNQMQLAEQINAAKDSNTVLTLTSTWPQFLGKSEVAMALFKMMSMKGKPSVEDQRFLALVNLAENFKGYAPFQVQQIASALARFNHYHSGVLNICCEELCRRHKNGKFAVSQLSTKQLAELCHSIQQFGQKWEAPTGMLCQTILQDLVSRQQPEFGPQDMCKSVIALSKHGVKASRESLAKIAVLTRPFIQSTKVTQLPWLACGLASMAEFGNIAGGVPQELTVLANEIWAFVAPQRLHLSDEQNKNLDMLQFLGAQDKNLDMLQFLG